MISVGSGDGRKGLGLGFGIRREMEETELEEGEACSFQNDDDSSIDPDVALSYIDEKLQDVLGHFQKDFEGGVSAENLGAKFGGYGSFLPAYPRSPVWSHPRASPTLHNHNNPKSPNNNHLEGGRQDLTVSSSASLLPRPGTASAIATSLRVPYVNDSARQDACILSASAVESTSKCEIMNNSTNRPDYKPLKVRIKVGSDNLLPRKNAEIYSGLGLDVSPSSSMDDSPTDSEGLSREPQDAPYESPNSILHIMTSFPVKGGILLSPLPDDLIRLTIKEMHRGESRYGSRHNLYQEDSKILMNESDSSLDFGKKMGENKPKSREKNASSLEMKNGQGKNARGGIDFLKKEIDIDTSACEELVNNALKLPLLVNCDTVDSANGTTKEVETCYVAHKFEVDEDIVCNIAKEEPLEALPAHDNCRGEKLDLKAGSAAMPWEDKKTNSHDGVSIYPRKDGNLKGEKTDVFPKAESNTSKRRKALNSECKDPLMQKAISHEEDGTKLPPKKEHSSSGSKKKSKGSQSHSFQGAEVSKDSLSVDSSLVRKNRKSTIATNYLPKNEVEDLKMPKNCGQARDRYTEFFGDFEIEQGGNNSDPVEMLSVDRLKDSEVIEKNTSAANSALKERVGAKKIYKLSTSDTCLKTASNVPPTGNGPISGAPPPGTAAPVVQEDWVGCDKCEKWRLLPLGTNPASLPEKWLCSMLTWLPGMNRCSIGEEETTKALRALYQIPVPESQNNPQGRPGGVMPGVISSVGRDTFSVATGGEKKHGFKEASISNQDDLSQFPNSVKKNIQASLKSRSLNGMNQSPSMSELDMQHPSNSRSITMEKQKHKPKEKNKVPDQYSDGGYPKNSKMKSKRETDQDISRVSKKIKTGSKHRSEEGHISDRVGSERKLDPSSSNVVSINASRSDQQRYNDHSFNVDFGCDAKNSVQVPGRHLKDPVQVASDDGSLHMGKCDDKDIVARKRKVKESQGSQGYSAFLPTTHQLHDSRTFVEETSENDHKNEKRAKISKFEGTETSGRKTSSGAARNIRGLKDPQLELDADYTLSQREVGSVQPSVAATSSSSKVSGSHKNKTNHQEAKGSPVESVSSSPLRVLNTKLTSMGRDVAGKDDFCVAGFSAGGTPKRCSEGEDEGGSERYGAIRKHHGSLESSVLDFQERDMGGHLSHSKSRMQPLQSPDLVRSHFSNGGTDTFGLETQYPCKPTPDQCRDEQRTLDHQYPANMPRSRKSAKGSSSWSKDRNGSSKPDFDKGRVKISDSSNESVEPTPCGEKPKVGKTRPEDKFGVNLDKVEKNLGKKDSAVKGIESSKRENQLKSEGHNGFSSKVDLVSSHDLRQNPSLDCDTERSSKRLLSDKVDREESGRGKSNRLPPSGRVQNDTGSSCPQLPGSLKENGPKISSVDATEGEDKVARKIKKGENQNGNHLLNSRHSLPSVRKVRDVDAPSPVRRDSSSQAATNALKEAKDLKHLADRVKNSGLPAVESTNYYFQAALKFLHGACILESGTSESAKLGEASQSKQIYSSTAKLCEFCAHEYEKSKDMAAAALAYKCMEVAYMRVIYGSQTGASRDRHELQAALQIVPPGESPSSSASDVDNLNNPSTVDKGGAFAKGVSSPQVAGNHVIAARNRNSFVRLLNFVQEVNLAMEASRKSRVAFEAANIRLDETQNTEGIASVKRALDFNFHDVEGLLRCVRLATEAISR